MLPSGFGVRHRTASVLHEPGQPVLGVAGVAAQWITTERRIANIRVELAERGLGRAEVRAIRGDECWRAREGFTWRTATATGVACAGPGSEVAIRETRAL